ncbi:FGGY-family carbohydrate kinase [Luteococcus sp. H138]|uniref:xylulokinase n=1 Tax=unclassified Luteococcus TaxID=2639923 RepID=UPI00313E755E
MDTTPLVIGVDSSTTSTKALVVDATGQVLAQASRPVAMLTPGMDRYEQDPREWWSSTREAVTDAIGQLDAADRARIQAMAVTPQRQSFALVDETGEPIRPGILWLDGRASEQVARIGSEEVHRLSGFQPDVTPSIYKIAWLSQHEPDHVARATMVASVHCYLTHALTGQWLDSAATADSLGMLDMAALTWSDQLVQAAGLRREQLPELVPPGEVLAELLPEVAADLGLTGPIPLVACCGDGQAAGLGCGAVRPDEAYLNMGTAVVAGVHSPEYRTADVYRTDAAGLPGHYVLEVVHNSGAYLAGWFRSQLGDPAMEGKPDPALDEAAAAVPVGCGGLSVLPYWNAVQSPEWDPLAKGAIVGLAGSHGRPEIYRAILEGLSVAVARNLVGLQESTGTPLTSVRVMGGGQRSPLWRQMMADALGLPLTCCETEEVSALGAAVMAMAHLGVHGSMAETATAMCHLGEVVQPDLEAHEVYRELAEIQAGLYPALQETFRRQADFAQRHGS